MSNWKNEPTSTLKALRKNFADGTDMANAVDSELKRRGENVLADMRGVKADTPTKPVKPAGFTGVKGELLTRDKSFAEYRTALYANGSERRSDPVDFDVEAYWAQRLGFTRPGSELRALGEDTSSGPGAGKPVTPQIWNDQVIDLLRSRLALTEAGMTVFEAQSGLTTKPVFVSDVQPAFTAENSPISLDANPAFAPLEFDTAGAHPVITLVSRQLMEDAFVQGGLSQFLADAIASRYARYVEHGALYGISGTASNAVPGLVNETGIQVLPRTVAETDTRLYSEAGSKVRDKNAEPSAFIMTPDVYAGLSTISGTAGFPAYFPVSQDVSEVPRIPTTGVSPGDLFAGDWRNLIMAVRSDLNITTLVERYADSGQIGLYGWFRFSVRAAHPETFVHASNVTFS